MKNSPKVLKENAKYYLIYRQMCRAEREITEKEGKLQPPCKGANGEKWLTEEINRQFTNNKVKTGVEEDIVCFKLKADYENEMKKGAIPQKNSKGMKDTVKYHQENLPQGGKLYNFGIPKSLISRFNKNIISVSVVKNLGPHK